MVRTKRTLTDPVYRTTLALSANFATFKNSNTSLSILVLVATEHHFRILDSVFIPSDFVRVDELSKYWTKQ